MRLKNWFTVPEGQKVTEKHLRRVLISSICSILLCMSCLAGTTWAWYVVGIESTENVINIGVPQVKVTLDGTSVDETKTSAELEPGTRVLKFEHSNEPDAFDRKSKLYVTLTIEGTDSQYIILDESESYVKTIAVMVDQPLMSTDEAVEGEPAPKTTKTISWQVTWFAPDGATMLIGDTIDLTAKSEDTTENENWTDDGNEEEPPAEEDNTAPEEEDNTAPEEGENNNENNQPGDESQGNPGTNDPETGDDQTQNDEPGGEAPDDNTGDDVSDDENEGGQENGAGAQPGDNTDVNQDSQGEIPQQPDSAPVDQDSNQNDT